MSLPDTGDARHDLAGGAVAALECVALDKSRLQRVQLLPLRQAFDGRDLAALRCQSWWMRWSNRVSTTADPAFCIFVAAVERQLSVRASHNAFLPNSMISSRTSSSPDECLPQASYPGAREAAKADSTFFITIPSARRAERDRLRACGATERSQCERLPKSPTRHHATPPSHSARAPPSASRSPRGSPKWQQP